MTRFKNTMRIPEYSEDEIREIVENADPAELALTFHATRGMPISELASLIHHYDKYGDQPFVGHLNDVARRVPAELKPLAYLHDSLEDHPKAWWLIRMHLDEELESDIKLLTHSPAEPYATYIYRLKRSQNERAIAVKIADLKSNLAHMPTTALAKRYRAALDILQSN